MNDLSIAVVPAAHYTPGMWKTVRLILCLVFFVPAFALLGALATLDSGERTAWTGLVAGAVVGLFFGLAFGGFRPRWFASLFGPAGRNRDGD
jgi:hypothetical protein